MTNLPPWREHFSFEVKAQDPHCAARSGVLRTPHGTIETPVFMPVGTHGAIKAQRPEELDHMGQNIILSNTYHLHLSPGEKLIQKLGGLHSFMGWDNAILTDSGGFQVFSLQKNALTEEGAFFKGPKGEDVALGPEQSIEIQQALGSDIMMAFDECIPYPATRSYIEKSMARTHRWLKRCLKTWSHPHQALFGIIQGGIEPDLRKRCVEEVCQHDLPGVAIGGVSVGEGPELMEQVVSSTAPLLPSHLPHYVMGVGTPEDLLTLWQYGIDMSDCIIPTKYARGGTAFTFRGKMRITHKRYRHDSYPLDTDCECSTCRKFSRAYIKHLFDANEVLGAILVTTHNLFFYNQLAKRARAAIREGRYMSFKKECLENFKRKS